MPGADSPLPPPEPFQEKVQPIEPPPPQQPPPQLQRPLDAPLREELLQQRRLPLQEDVRQATITTALPTDAPTKVSVADTSTKDRSGASPKSNTIGEHEATADIVRVGDLAVAGVETIDTGGYNSEGMTDSERLISYLLGRFPLLHREGRLEEAAATLQQALSIMEGRMRNRRDDAAAAVESNIPEDRSFPANFDIADRESDAPYGGEKEMEGASRDELGVEREYSDSFGSRFGPGRELLERDLHLESSAAASEASAIAGVMNDLGCTLQQVQRGLLVCLACFLITLFGCLQAASST